MKIPTAYLFIAFIIGLSAANTQAESMRCKNDLAQIGDTKADILEKCGDPIITDTFCRPFVPATQLQANQDGENNIQNNIVTPICEDVDVWTYRPAKGQFITHLYFVQGKLRQMEYGDRVK